MHSFLSKVFGRKKDDKETSPTTLRPGELLDGKFEAISPNVSPSATNFLELDSQAQASSAKDNDKDVGFSLFRAKSRPSPPEIRGRKPDTLPHLSLNFNTTNEDANPTGSDSLFALDLNSQILLSDAIIGRRRLNPLEALVLIRACSQAIVSKGLETLGIMHPHWYSASPDVQRRLISQFIHSMEPKTPPTAFSPNSEVSSPFESEINFTRSPHDVAAVLRWGLRHVQLEGDSFGTDDGWYKAFLDAEAAAEYPPKAFSEKLAPLLPPAHLELLIATLEIFSSLASHSEVNSTSGSKLSKIFGLWLLTARQIEDKDDWQSFYARWERTGRMLEHLFLSRIRDESTDQRMPVRLLELVRRYPYTHGLSSPTTDLQLLPPPQFTTQVHDAFFVRIEVELPSERRKPKLKVHPLNILADAFSTKVEEGEFAELWTKITAASKNGSNPSPLSNIFADETIRFLSIIPDKNPGKSAEVKSPTFSLLPVSPSSPRGQTFSTGDTAEPAPVHHPKSATEPSPASAASHSIGSDWVQFSSSGFLDTTPAIAPLVSTLFDTDVEKTTPAVTTLSRKSSKRTKAASRKSVDFSSDPVKPVPEVQTEVVKKEPASVVKATKLQIIQVDEAFIDFWSDSLLDPITATWPTFIICKFKSTLVPKLVYGPVEDGKQKTLKWLVLEQVITVKPAPAPAPLASPSVSISETARPVSPALSTSGRNRFSFWNMSRTTSSSSQSSQKGKKKEKVTNVGEMGELLEEDANHQVEANLSKKKSTTKSRKSTSEKAKESTQKPADAVVTPAAAPASGTEVPSPVIDKVASPEADGVQERSTPPGSKAPLAIAATAAVATAGIVTEVGLQNPESEAEKVEPTSEPADTSPQPQDKAITQDSEPLAAVQSDLEATPGQPSDVPPMASIDSEITTRDIPVEPVAEAVSEADIPQIADVTPAPLEPQAANIQAAPLEVLDDHTTVGTSLETATEDIPAEPAVDDVAEAEISQLTEVTSVSAEPDVAEIQTPPLPVLSDSAVEETFPEAATESIPVESIVEAVSEAETSQPIEVIPVAAEPDVVDNQNASVEVVNDAELEKTSQETTTLDVPVESIVEAVTESEASQPTEGVELDVVNVQTAPLTALSDPVGEETFAETTAQDIPVEPLTEAALGGDISQTEVTPVSPKPDVVDIQDVSVQVNDDTEIEEASLETTTKDLLVESVVESIPEAEISQPIEVTPAAAEPDVVNIQDASLQVTDDIEIEKASLETTTKDLPVESIVDGIPEAEISRPTEVTVTSAAAEPDVVNIQDVSVQVTVTDDAEVENTSLETTTKDLPVESVVDAVPETGVSQPTEATIVSAQPDIVDIQNTSVQAINDAEVENASPEPIAEDILLNPVVETALEPEVSHSTEVVPVTEVAPLSDEPDVNQNLVVQANDYVEVENASPEPMTEDILVNPVIEPDISQSTEAAPVSDEPDVNQNLVVQATDDVEVENASPEPMNEDILVNPVVEPEIPQSTEAAAVSDESDVNQNLAVQDIDDVEVQETSPETMTEDHPVESVVESIQEVENCQPTEIPLVSVEPDVVDIQIPAVQAINDSKVEEPFAEATNDISIDSVTEVVSEAENAQSVEVTSAPVDSDAAEVQATLVQPIESSAVEKSSTTETIPANYVTEAISEAEISQASEGNAESVKPDVDDSQVVPITDVTQDIPTSSVAGLATASDVLLEESHPPAETTVPLTAEPLAENSAANPGEQLIDTTSPENITSVTNSTSEPSTIEEADGLHVEPDNVAPTVERQSVAEGDVVDVEEVGAAVEGQIETTAVGEDQEVLTSKMETVEGVDDPPNESQMKIDLVDREDVLQSEGANTTLLEDPPREEPVEATKEPASETQGPMPVDDVDVPDNVILGSKAVEDVAEVSKESIIVVPEDEPLAFSEENEVSQVAKSAADVEESSSKEPTAFATSLLETSEDKQGAVQEPTVAGHVGDVAIITNTEITETVKEIESTAPVNEEEKLEFTLNAEPSGPVKQESDDLQAQAEHVEGSSISSETLKNDSASAANPVAYSGTAVEDENLTDNGDGVISETLPEAQETQHSDGQYSIPLVEEQSSGAAAAPEQPLFEPTTSESVNITSEIPTVVSMVLPEDSAAEAAIDFAPVPLIANPIEPAQESHLIGHEEGNTIRESEDIQDVSSHDIELGSDISASHRALDLDISAGSTPGPQTSLAAAMVDLNEAERSPVSSIQHKLDEAEKPTSGAEEPDESIDAAERISPSASLEDHEGTPRLADEISLDEAPSQKSDVAGLTSEHSPLGSAEEIQAEGDNVLEHVNETGPQEDNLHITLSDSALERQASTVEDDEPTKDQATASGHPVDVIEQVPDDVYPAISEGASVVPLEAPVVSPEGLESVILAEPVPVANVSQLNSDIVDSSAIEETIPRQLVEEEPPTGYAAGNTENEHPIDAGIPLETESNQTAFIEVTKSQEDDQPPTEVEATKEDISSATDAPVSSDIHVIPLHQPQEITKKGEPAQDVAMDQNMLAGSEDVKETSTNENFTPVPGIDVLNAEPMVEAEAHVLTPAPALNGLESSESDAQKDVISDDDPAHSKAIEAENREAATEGSTIEGIVEAIVPENNRYTAEGQVLPSQESNELGPLDEAPGATVEQLSVTSLSQEEEPVALAKDVLIEELLPEQASTVGTADDEPRSTAEESEELSRQPVAEVEQLTTQDPASYDGPPALSQEQGSPTEQPSPVLPADEEKTMTDGATEIKQPDAVSEDTADSVPDDHTTEEISTNSEEPVSAGGEEILAVEEPTGVFDGPAAAAEQPLSDEIGGIRDLDAQIVPEDPEPQINEPESVHEVTLSQATHVSPERDGEGTMEPHNTLFTEEPSSDDLKSTAVEQFVDQTDRQPAIIDQDDEGASKTTDNLIINESNEQGSSPSAGALPIDEITSIPMEISMAVEEQPAVAISDDASSVPLGQAPSDESLPIEFEGEEQTEVTKPELLISEEASSAVEVADHIEEASASPALEFLPPTSELVVEESVPAEVAEPIPVDKPAATLNEAPGEPSEPAVPDQVLEHKSPQEGPASTLSSDVVDSDHTEEPSVNIEDIHREGTGAEALVSGEVLTVEEVATAEFEGLVTSGPHESALNEGIPSDSQVGAAEEVIPDPDAAISIHEPASIENIHHETVTSELSEKPTTIVNSDIRPAEGVEEVTAPDEIAEQAVQDPEVPVNGVVSQEESMEASNDDDDDTTGTEHPGPAEHSELPLKDSILAEAVAEERLVPIVDDVPSEENLAPEVPNIAEDPTSQESPESTGEDVYSHEKAEHTPEAHEDLLETEPLVSTDNLPTREHAPAAVEEPITVGDLEQPNEDNALSDKSGESAGQFITEEQSFAEESLSATVEEPAIAEDIAQSSQNDSQLETVKVAHEEVLGDSAVEPETDMFVSKEQNPPEELSPIEVTTTVEDLERPAHDDSLLKRSEADSEQPPVEESAVEVNPKNELPVAADQLPAAAVEEPTAAEEFVEPSNGDNLPNQLELEQPTLEVSAVEVISTEHLSAQELQPLATEEPMTVDDTKELPREESALEISEVALDQPKTEESSTEPESGSHVSTEKLATEELQSLAVEEPITVKDPEQAIHEESLPEKSEVSLEAPMIEESSAELENEPVALAEQSAPEEPLTVPVEEPITVDELAQVSRDESLSEVSLEHPGDSVGDVDPESLVSTEQLAADAHPAAEVEESTVEEPMTGGSPKAPPHEDSLPESPEASLDLSTVKESPANPTGVIGNSAATGQEEEMATELAEPTEQPEPATVEQSVSALDKRSAEETLVEEQPSSPNMAIVDVIPVDSAEITVVEPETTGDKGDESPMAQIQESSLETTGDEPTDIEIESPALQEPVAELDQDVPAVQSIIEQAGSTQESSNEADDEIFVEGSEAVIVIEETEAVIFIEEAEAVDATLSLDDLHEMLPSPSTEFSTVDPDESFATSGPFALESVMSSIGEETDDIDDNDPILDVDSKVSEAEDDALNENGNGHYSTSDAGLSEPVAAIVETDKDSLGVMEEAENTHSQNGADPSVVEVLSADSESPSATLHTVNGHNQETEKSAAFAPALSEEGEPATVETLTTQEPMSTSLEV